MIRKFTLGHRLQAAAGGSHPFAPCNHLGERIEATKLPSSTVPSLRPSSAQLKEVLKARRVRSNFFDAHLFADPAWDILLLAYVAMLDDELLLVSTLLRKSLVPATTMLRWVRALEQHGLLDRAEPDIPRFSLRLSAAGAASMERYFAAVWPSLPV